MPNQPRDRILGLSAKARRLVYPLAAVTLVVIIVGTLATRGRATEDGPRVGGDLHEIQVGAGRGLLRSPLAPDVPQRRSGEVDARPAPGVVRSAQPAQVQEVVVPAARERLQVVDYERLVVGRDESLLAAQPIDLARRPPMQDGISAAVAWHFTQSVLADHVPAAAHPALAALSRTAEALPLFRAAPHGEEAMDGGA